MKKLLFLFVLLWAGIAFGQKPSLGYLRYDSLYIERQGGNAELILKNASRDLPGFLFNKGNGRTEFKRPLTRIDDSTYLVGADTLHLPASSIGKTANTLQNFVSDSLIVYDLNVGQDLTDNNYVRQTDWAADATETVVDEGLQITNSYSGSVGTNNIAIAPWLSGSTNCTTDLTFIVNAFTSTSQFGIAQYTQQYVGFGNTAFFTVKPSNHTVNYYFGSTTLPYTIDIGDVMNIKVRRVRGRYTISYTNLTKNQTAVYTATTTNVNTVRKLQPSLYGDNDIDVTVTSYKYYVTNLRPDLMIIGDSRLQNVYLANDSAFASRLEARTTWKINDYTQSTNTIENVTAMMPEIIKHKPRAIFIQIGAVNLALGDDTSTWHPRYVKLIDSLLLIGCNLIVGTEFPMTAADNSQIRDWLIENYGNNKFVKIIDLWATTPLYDAGGTNSTAAAYANDNLHPNNAGVKILADSAIKWLIPYVNFIDSLRGEPGGGGGATAFTDLTDAPSTYSGQASKYVAVKSDESGVEFVSPSGGSGINNANVGSSYRLLKPISQEIKTLSVGYGLLGDSATTNTINVKLDSSTVFPAIRATISGGGGIGGSSGSTDNRIIRADGTGGSTVQNSGIAIDDNGVLQFPWGNQDIAHIEFDPTYYGNIQWNASGRSWWFDAVNNGQGSSYMFNHVGPGVGGIGINVTNASTSYDLEINGKGGSTDGILVASSTFTGVPNPGSESNKIRINGRGVGGSTDSKTVSSAFQPDLGFAFAVSRAKPAAAFYNDGSGPAIGLQGHIWMENTVTPPSSNLTNGIILYAEDVASSSELKVRDEAGNVTNLGPHTQGLLPKKLKPFEWSFDSYNSKYGQVTVNMYEAIKTIENLTKEVEELKALINKNYKKKKPVKLIYTKKAK